MGNKISNKEISGQLFNYNTTIDLDMVNQKSHMSDAFITFVPQKKCSDPAFTLKVFIKQKCRLFTIKLADMNYSNYYDKKIDKVIKQYVKDDVTGHKIIVRFDPNNELQEIVYQFNVRQY